MPAIAAIVNRAVPDSKSINLFYNTGTAQLALAYKNGGDGEDPDTPAWAADASDVSGNIVNPTSLASDYFCGNQIVIAVTSPGFYKAAAIDVTTNQISMVSPVYMKLAANGGPNRALAICSSGNNAWVYFLDGLEAGQVRLKEYNFEHGKISTFLEHQDVLLSSSLAAWYNPATKERFVIYQEMGQGHLKEFNTVQKQSWDIGGTRDAKDLTPMAVSYAKGKTYLYYTDGRNNICCTTKDQNGWGNTRFVDGIPKIDSDSQMSVVAANDVNHLFYVSNENPGSFNKFEHARDPLQ